MSEASSYASICIQNILVIYRSVSNRRVFVSKCSTTRFLVSLSDSLTFSMVFGAALHILNIELTEVSLCSTVAVDTALLLTSPLRCSVAVSFLPFRSIMVVRFRFIMSYSSIYPLFVVPTITVAV